jgi:UDP-N-acetylglucosamine diphosphorylase / glucose-1-phosphate thymidylyltransferase / UDP-N-acetylgalactosamine diphosphorylase / glucosamine-1-phosphate N-acetyltransferase / galactosamine-1-phosphate N-acetyltransferase
VIIEMKGVILAGGEGGELNPISIGTVKAMVPIIGKPLIQYAIERLKQHDIIDITIVLGKLGDQIKSYFGNGKDFDVRINYTYQPEGTNTIEDAIKTLKPTFEDEDQFVLLHTDIIVDHSMLTRTLNAVNNLGTEMGLAVTLEKEIQDFGVVSLKSNGLVDKVHPTGVLKQGNYVVAGTFVLSGKVFKYLDDGIAFNECFNKFIEDGGEVASGVWNEKWVDVGRPWDILRANRLLLDNIKDTHINSRAIIGSNTTISGAVIIEAGAKILAGSHIIGPAYIGKNALIGNNSLIRDGTVIEDNAIVGMGCEIKGSVLLKGCTVARLSYIGDTLIGSKSVVHAGCVTINQHPDGSKIMSKVNEIPVEVPLEKFGCVIGPSSYIYPNCTIFPGVIIKENSIIQPNMIIKMED